MSPERMYRVFCEPEFNQVLFFLVPYMPLIIRASQLAPVVRRLPASAGDTRDVGLVPGSGRSPEQGLAIHSSTLAWRVPWTEEPGGLQSMGSQRVRHD